MKIYLDLCCFNRPFDDQRQLLVRLQTEAKLVVQQWIQEGHHCLVWSSILDLENIRNPDEERSNAISAWKMIAECDMDTTDSIERIAITLESVGLKSMDALHVASAIEANADRFLTTDKNILNKLKRESRIVVLDPIDFIREMEGSSDEE